jgi:lipoate-protein ligase B
MISAAISGKNVAVERVTNVYQLGLMEYSTAYELQKTFHGRRLRGEAPDALLLLEHTPTFTIGKSGRVDNILASRDTLKALGISLFLIERGGDATYHGPGQIVGYPIIDLRNRGKDIRRFVYDLEEVLVRTLRDFSVEGKRDPTHPGVWVNHEEVAAIGLSVRKWVSMHGFALNVNTRMEHFSLINPCGFTDRKAVSISQLLSREVPLEQVTERLLLHFSSVFETRVVITPPPTPDNA